LTIKPEEFVKISSKIPKNFKLNITDKEALGVYVTTLTYGNVSLKGNYNPNSKMLIFNNKDLRMPNTYCGTASDDLYILANYVSETKIVGNMTVKYIGNCEGRTKMNIWVTFSFEANK